MVVCGGRGGGQELEAKSNKRLGGSPRRLLVKKNKRMAWGEDGELWLMRKWIEWGSNTWENSRYVGFRGSEHLCKYARCGFLREQTS